MNEIKYSAENEICLKAAEHIASIVQDQVVSTKVVQSPHYIVLSLKDIYTGERYELHISVSVEKKKLSVFYADGRNWFDYAKEMGIQSELEYFSNEIFAERSGDRQ